MVSRRLLIVCALALIMVLTGCGGVRASRDEMNAAPSAKIAELSHGYALLYGKAQELAKIHDLLRVKLESDETATLIDDLSSYGEKLSRQLESLVKRYPSLSLDDEGKPLVEKKKSDEIAHYYLKEMAPVTGRTGKDFERTLLMTQSDELNIARFYARALASIERDSNRRKLVVNAQKRLDALYQKFTDRLEKDYYVH